MSERTSWMGEKLERGATPFLGLVDEPRWRHPRATGPLRKLVRAVGRTVFVLGLLFSVGTGFVSVLLWLQPPPPARLLLIGAGYEDDLAVPPHVAGRRALEELAQLADTSAPWSAVFPGSGRLHVAEGVVEFHAGKTWSAGLRRCTEPTMVVFFAAYAGADTDGPFLVPSHAGPAPPSRVRFEQVLDQFAALPAQKKKLLILDCAELDDDWTMGILHRGFVRGVAALETRIAAIPNLVVIVSSDVEQHSWDWGLGGPTVFSHFLLDSLSQASRKGRGSCFTAWDLYADVRNRVQHWVATHRRADQTPLLLPREGGEERARAIPLVFRLETVAAPAQTDPLPAIQAAWQRWETLRRDAPAAVTRTPHLWRQFEALTLRQEQLLLAGDRSAVEGIRDRALAVEREIRQRQVLALRSATGTLAMPALGGETILDLPGSYTFFEQLWSARPDERSLLWSKLRSAKGPGLPEEASLRRRLFGLLVRRAADDPQQNLAVAADLVRMIRDPAAGILPAEAHFLVMLHRDLPRPLSERSTALAGRALRTRLLAEEAALGLQDGIIPHSEYVLPWFREAIASADEDRRRGEDLLFATEPDDLAEAARHLGQAEEGYRQAIADAATARFAIQQRDEAAHELAHYARWASRSPTHVLQQVGASVASLWKQVHELERVLEAAPSRSRLAEAKARAGEVQAGLAKLRTRFDDCVKDATGSGTADWETLCALLEVPTISLPSRMVLLQKRLQLERLAIDGLEPPSPAAAAKPAGLEDQQVRARIRGEMALAALGERWFNACKGRDRESYAEVLHRLETFAQEPQWWQSLAKAESQIGDRWRWLSAEADRLVNLIREEADPDRVRVLLGEGDQLVRRTLVVDSAVTASRKVRDWLVAQALLFQASRIEGDHWADERPGAEPYYRIAARAMLRDARFLSQKESFVLSGLAVLETRLDSEDRLDLQATSRVHLTPGEVARLTVSLAGPLRRGLAGFPVVWCETPPSCAGDDVLQLVPNPPGQRTVMTIGQVATPVLRRVEVASPWLERLERVPPPTPTPIQARVVWWALHRGFRVERTTEISLHARADLVFARQSPPPDAAVAVAADGLLLRRAGRARGALAIVLDCSGSMGTVGSQSSAKPTRFQLVTQALRELLENTPPGTAVSLWVFGQAIGEEKTAEAAEATIARLQDPVTWTGELAQVREVLARVERLTPWNESPILRAMLAARQDLLRADGPRTMIVLTDGIDNRFARDRETNPSGESVPDALRHHFQGTGIEIHVVGFQVANREDGEAHRQFAPVTDLDPPGTFCTVDEMEALLAIVRRVGRVVLPYRLEVRDGLEAAARPSPLAGTMSVDDETLRWVAIPLEGRTRLYDLNLPPGPRIAENLLVSPGDALSLRLVPRGADLGLQRLPFAPRIDLPSGRVLKCGNWLAAVAQFKRNEDGALQLLMTLEPQPADDEKPLRIRHPADLWIDVSSADGRAFAVRWQPAFGLPASAWSIDVPAWPAGPDQTASPVLLRAWWLDKRPAPPCVSLHRPEDFRAPETIARRVRIDGGEVAIESVGVECRQVEAGEKARPSAGDVPWCVAVRISYPTDRPVRASLEGLGVLCGEEHRYYREAGKYVGLFRLAGLTTQREVRERLESDLQALHLTSLSAICQEAERNGHAVEFVNLGTPAAGNEILPPPLSLE